MIKYTVYSTTQNSELQIPCVVTIGKFDGVHFGHQKLLKAIVKEANDLNLVSTVITFEPHPREYFAKETNFQTLQNLNERIESIFNTGIDQVIVLEFNSYLEKLTAQEFFDELLIDRLNVKSILVGDDFRFGIKKHCDIDCLTSLCNQNKVKLLIIDRVHDKDEPISSSKMRQEKFGVS